MNADDSLVAVGTECANEDAFIFLFSRDGVLLANFGDAHSDDITCIRFNALVPTLFASGSTDGLVNVFDASVPLGGGDPDEAVVHTEHTESSVAAVDFFGPAGEYLYGSCVATASPHCSILFFPLLVLCFLQH